VGGAGLRAGRGGEVIYFIRKGAGAIQLARPVPAVPSRGQRRTAGDVLFSQYLLPFEVASILLLVAIVGSVAWPRRERDAAPDHNRSLPDPERGAAAVGTIGVLTRRNIVIILMSIELILNAVNINLVAFSATSATSSGRFSPSS